MIYVTSFLDINRSSWTNHRRSFDQYLISFRAFIHLFDNQSIDKMVVFIDKKHFQVLKDQIRSNITLIPISIQWMIDNVDVFKSIDRENDIMKDNLYRSLLGDRQKFPEHNYPLYTMINHAKIDLVCKAIDMYQEDDIFAWVDFGFFADASNIPIKLLDKKHFLLDKMNYHLINHIHTVENHDPIFHLQHAPELIGGFFFISSSNVLKLYKTAYNEMVDFFHQNNIQDDDQHIVLQLYYKYPNLFSFTGLGWHNVLTKYQII